jgi:hypothetical protein
MMTVLVVLLGGSVAAILALYNFLSNRLGPDADDRQDGGRSAQYAVAGLVVMLSIAVVAYRLLLGNGLGQTAALFIGVPALAAIAAVFAPARSALGVAMKAVTIGLLIAMMFLQEGAVCVLLSAPLFYLVALVIGWAVGRSKSGREPNHVASWMALTAILPMSLEGVLPATTIARDVRVSETRIIGAPSAAVERAIASTPRFDRPLPPFLAIGFPRPAAAWIDGNRWIIRMRGGELRLSGMEPRTGDLVLMCDERAPGAVGWRAMSDNSHMTHFLNWTASRVSWQAIDARTTRVTWTLEYRRGIDPAWYFGPMERYAMHLAAGYLIDAVATP